MPNLQMAKGGPMDIFIKQRHPVAENESNSEYDDGDVNETGVLTTKRIRTSFTLKHDTSYIKFGFVATNDNGEPKPQCIICGDLLANDATKPSKLKRNLKKKKKKK
jgi:hypothetical protein